MTPKKYRFYVEGTTPTGPYCHPIDATCEKEAILRFKRSHPDYISVKIKGRRKSHIVDKITPELIGPDPVTLSDIRRRTNLSDSSVTRIVRVMYNAGKLHRDGKGTPYSPYVFWAKSEKDVDAR